MSDSEKKGQLITGASVIVVSLSLLGLCAWKRSAFLTCDVPMNIWNLTVLMIIALVGFLFVLNGSSNVQPQVLVNLLKTIILTMILLFLWGDIFFIMLLVDTPKCLPMWLVVTYGVVLVVGSLAVAGEAINLLRQLVAYPCV